MRLGLILALVLVACGTSDPGDQKDDAGTNGADAGQTTDAGGDETDAGEGEVDETCDEELAEEPCDGVTEGSCNPGVRVCFEGVWTACEGRIQPLPGACDTANCAGGENDGCECRVGTSRSCYDGDPDTLGPGTCRQGFQECVATATGSEWGPCVNQVLPQPEDCSGRDLDCVSGLPEKGCDCTDGETRPCGGVTGGTCELGTQTCSGGTWGACEGAVQPDSGNCAVESCLGGPNPGCECVIGETEPCYTGIFGTEGVGTCTAGTRTCDGSGQWGDCLDQVRPLPFCDVESCTGTANPACE